MIEAPIAAEERLVEGAHFIEGSRDGATQTVELDLIEAGFGNGRDMHFYSDELLAASLAQFNAGVIMYSNHLNESQERALEGQPRPWQDIIGRIIPGSVHTALNEDGRTVLRGKARIANPLAWQYIEADPEILKVSINARGVSTPEMIEGKQARRVQSIHTVKSVDVVSQAGAGGKIHGIAEAFLESAEAEATKETTVDPTETPETTPETPAAEATETPAAAAAEETPAAAEAPAAEAPAEGAPAAADVQEGGFCKSCKKPGKGEKCSECGGAYLKEGDEGYDEAVAEAEAELDEGEADEDLDIEEGEWTALDADEMVREARSGGRRGSTGAGAIPSGASSQPVATEFGQPGWQDPNLGGEINPGDMGVSQHDTRGHVSTGHPGDPTLKRGASGAGAIPSGASTQPVAAEFNQPGWQDPNLAGEIEHMYADENPDPRNIEGSQAASPEAAHLARQIEAEVETRVTDRLDDAVEEALVSARRTFQHALNQLVVEHDAELEQVEQRFAARELIRESDLPEASKKRLMVEFHDFYAEPVMEGDDEAKSARTVLEEAVALAIDEKAAELREAGGGVAEARVAGAGRSGGSQTPSADMRESAPEGERPTQAPLDEQLDAELGIAPEAPAES